MSAARAAALAAALSLSASPFAARAQEPDLRLDTEPELRHATSDIWITVAGYGLALGADLAKDRLAPETCRWCGTNALDDGVRNLLLWDHSDRARTASNVLVVAMPAAVAGYTLLAGKAGPGLEEGAWDLLYVAEAGALAEGLTTLVKFVAGRQRPYAVHGNWAEADRAPDPDDNLSFWSAHTSFTFALAAGAGTIASMRGRDEAPWVWTVGMVAASAVGYFRIAADKHHFTDVLAGAAVGTALGIGVPRLRHGEREDGEGGVTLVPLLPMGIAGTF